MREDLDCLAAENERGDAAAGGGGLFEQAIQRAMLD